MFDLQGNLLVDVTGRILKYDAEGHFLGNFALSSTSGYMAIDPLGNVYAGSGGEDGVYKFDATGRSLGKIVRAGIGGVPTNFRSEAVVYFPSTIPEPAALGVALLAMAVAARRRHVAESSPPAGRIA